MIPIGTEENKISPWIMKFAEKINELVDNYNYLIAPDMVNSVADEAEFSEVI